MIRYKLDPKNIEQVERKRTKILNLRKEAYNKLWVEFINKTICGAGEFWGYYRKSNEKYKRYFHFNKDKRDLDRPVHQDAELFARTLTMEQVPLHLDNLYPEVSKTIKSILSGHTDIVPHRQDLVDEYYKLEKRYYRLNRLLIGYSNIINRHLDDLRRMYKRYIDSGSYDTDIKIILTINGREYSSKGLPYNSCQNQNIHYEYPEENTLTFNVDDFIYLSNPYPRTCDLLGTSVEKNQQKYLRDIYDRCIQPQPTQSGGSNNDC